MTQLESTSPTSTTLTLHRQRVLARANALLSGQGEIPFIEQFDAVPQLSALLATALDDLKTADEELARERATISAHCATLERTIAHYERLFAHAPAPMFVTDLYGTIQEVNHAGVQLMKRDADHLLRKSMAALMPKSERTAFRDRLQRLAIAESVDDWRFTLQRAADVPIEVTAAVRLVPGIGHTGKGVLEWLVRPVRPMVERRSGDHQSSD